MLDQNDLQAIAELMDARLQQQKDELTALIKEESNAATSRAIAYSENVIEAKLDLIKEGLDLALETHIPVERIDRIEENITALKVVVREHSRDIDKLKKAQ